MLFSRGLRGTPCPCIMVLFSLSLAFLMEVSGKASSPTTEFKPVELAPPQAIDYVSFASIGKSTPEIVLYVESAKVTIRTSHSKQDITLSSNCPSHWNVAGRSIRQVAMSSVIKGTVLRADANGSYVVANGRVYQLPSGTNGAIRNLKVEKGAVSVNNQALEPMAGSDKPGSCVGPDVLEVVVPQDFTGGLLVSCQRGSSVALDDWSGSNLIMKLHGLSTFSGTRLSCFDKAVIDVQGEGEAQIKGLSVKTLVANINGSGRVVVDGGKADVSNATVTGGGSVVLKGKFGTLSKSVSGNGTIEVLK